MSATILSSSARAAAADPAAPADPGPRRTHLADAGETLDVRLGVSACLLGRNVRLDGGHKRNAFLVDAVGPHVEFVAVCPEMEMGLGAPRPAMRLERTGAGGTRLSVPATGEDLTSRMGAYADDALSRLAAARLDGFVLKKDSPTCGLLRVKVYDRNGSPSRDGQGHFARRLVEHLPFLPVEEEGRLNDPVLRERFVLRAWTHARWRRLRESGPGPADLVRFHTAHKLLLLAHDRERYRALGRLTARAGIDPLSETLDRYGALLMEALARPTSRGRHVDVMQHLLGFVKTDLTREDKVELAHLLGEYRAGRVPLAVPVTLLRHLLRRHAAGSWVEEQVYLAPHPADLMLRNAT